MQLNYHCIISSIYSTSSFVNVFLLWFVAAKTFFKDQILDKLASDRISDVVDAYEHALLGVFPRARYVVGLDARFFFMPLQKLPEWLSDWIQANTSKARPRPAILRKWKHIFLTFYVEFTTNCMYMYFKPCISCDMS